MSLQHLRPENKAGIYATVIVHLVVIIILLLTRIATLATKESSFVLDFTKEEELRKRTEMEKRSEDISKELDRMIRETRRQPDRKIRNIAVDAGEKLKDDRGANDVYDQARELQRKLYANRNAALAEQKAEDAVDMSRTTRNANTSGKRDVSYSGPSVVSYTLDGRKAMNLRIPAYKCQGGGDVTVIIEVNRQGRVVSAKVMEEVSENDRCLQEYAVRAAKQSSFTASEDAPLRQTGEIVYRFVAQH